MEGMRSSETIRLLRRPGFTRYFATVAAARATGTMFTVAGVLLVLERTHDLALSGLVVAAATLPAAVTGPFLGAWLDVTASRRRLLVLDRVMTAAGLGLMLVLAGHASNWLLPLAALVYGATTPLSSGAFSAVLPEVAGPELIGIANAFEAASVNAAFIVGPALAGLIAALAGPVAAVEVQIVTGLVLAALIVGDETFELRPHHDGPAPESVRQAVSEGLRAIWRIVPLRWNTVIDCLYVLAWGMLYVGFPAYAVSVGAGAHAAGYMWAAVSAGSLLGGFALRRRGGGPSPRLLLGGSLLTMAASVGLWLLAGDLLAALALIFMTGVCDGPGLVELISIRQRLAPPRLRAQIFTSAASLHFAFIAAGTAGAGIFQQAFGTDATLAVFAAVLALAGAVSLLGESDGERSGAATALRVEPAGPVRAPLGGE